MHLNFYQCEYFRIEELVPKELHERHWRNVDFLWSLFNPYALWTMDAIRDHYGLPMACNDWLWGGKFHGRGFRPDGYMGGALYSAHKRGCGIDLWPMPESVTGVSIRDDIIAYPWWEPFQYITCVESGVRHLHFDLRNHDREKHGILVVHP